MGERFIDDGLPPQWSDASMLKDVNTGEVLSAKGWYAVLRAELPNDLRTDEQARRYVNGLLMKRLFALVTPD